MKLASATRNAAADAVVDLIDGDGGGPGYIQIRTGSPPASPQVSATGTLLATLTFSPTAFGNAGAVVTGRADAATITGDSSIDATGTAGWFRVYDADNAPILDGTVGTSGADINFNSVSFVAGGACNITSLTVTMPE